LVARTAAAATRALSAPCRLGVAARPPPHAAASARSHLESGRRRPPAASARTPAVGGRCRRGAAADRAPRRCAARPGGRHGDPDRGPGHRHRAHRPSPAAPAAAQPAHHGRSAGSWRDGGGRRPLAARPRPLAAPVRHRQPAARHVVGIDRHAGDPPARPLPGQPVARRSVGIRIAGMNTTALTLWIGVLHLLGVFAAMHAVTRARTPQGAVGWALGLLLLPYVTLLPYLYLGSSRFFVYHVGHPAPIADAIPAASNALTVEPACARFAAIGALQRWPFRGGHQLQL